MLMQEPRRTVLRFLFPAIAMAWGTLMVMSTKYPAIIESSPRIYGALSEYWSLTIWGAISLVIGIYCVFADVSKNMKLILIGTAAHCALLAALTFVFLKISPVGAVFYVIFCGFKAAHTFELTFIVSSEQR